jgi:hypothetical protein
VPFRFSRLSSTNVAFQVHVREDSRFAILPIMPPSKVRGWTVYDVETGEIISPEPFNSFIAAKEWLEKK